MPSKGIDFYGFVAEGYELEVRKADAGNKDDPDTVQIKPGDKPLRFSSDHYEIDTNHWVGRYEGKFQFIARKDGRELFERSVRVNGDTGNINDDDLNNIMIPSRVEGDYSLSFGLYDSDHSDPNAHQIYACLTPNRRAWQSDFFRRVDKSAFKLKNMVLPGSHDAGMYNRMFTEASNLANTQKDSVDKQLALGARYFDYRPGTINNNLPELLSQATDNMNKFLALMIVAGVVAMPILGPAAFVLAGGIGTAAYLVLKGKINSLVEYIQPKVGRTAHIHAVIPGETLDDFFGRIANFLQENREEIVVVNVVDSGIVRKVPIPKGSLKQFVPDSAKSYIPDFIDMNVPDIYVNGSVVNGTDVELINVPKKASLVEQINGIIQNRGIKLGDKSTLDKPVADIIESNERLVIFFWEDSVQANDSYTKDYQSYDANRVIKAIDDTLAKHDSTDFTKLQLQLTPTGETKGILRAVKGSNPSTSPLFATKPRTDIRSYQHLLSNQGKVKDQNKLVAIQNDFYDNALTEVAIALNKFNAGVS